MKRWPAISESAIRFLDAREQRTRDRSSRNKDEWILNATYPKGDRRLQTPHLYHIKTNRRIDLGEFPLHPAYKGGRRVDNHPRLSRDERTVCIDSPHTNEGRQLPLIDISGIV